MKPVFFRILSLLLWSGMLSYGPVSAQPNLSGIQNYQQGNFDQAIKQWKSDLQQSSILRDRQQQGQLWTYLSLAYQKQSQWILAQAASEQSLWILQKSSPALYAQALNTQGQLSLALGDVHKANEAWKQAETLYRSINDLLGTRGSLINQAIAYEQGGFYRRACLSILNAIQSSNRCEFSSEQLPLLLAQFRQLSSPALEVIALNTLSRTLIEMGDLRGANITLNYLLNHHPSSSLETLQTSATLASEQSRSYQQDINRSRSQRRQKRLKQELQAAFQKAEQAYIQLLSQIPQQNSIKYYAAQVDYVYLLIEQGKVQNFASNHTTKTIQGILASLNPPKDIHQRSAYMARIKHAEALISLQQYTVTRDPGHYSPQTLLNPLLISSDQSSTVSERQAFAAGALGRFYEVNQQWANAESYTKQALMRSPTADYTYRWQWQLGRILQAKNQQQESIQAYQQALTALNNVRQNLTVLQRNAQFSFRDEIEPSYRELVSVLLKDESPSAQRLTQARQVIDQLQVTEVEDFLLQNCIKASLASLDSFIAHKETQSAIIYTIIQEQSLDVILKVRNQIAFHRVHASKQEIQDTLKAYRLLLQDKLPSATQHSQTYSQKLYQWMVAPFKKQLANTDTLVFVLDGELRDIPMATLHDGNQYLIEQYSVAITPGLQILDIQSLQANQERMLVAGASRGDRKLGLPPLPAVRRELKQISNLIPKAKVLIDNAFSEIAFQSALERDNASIIHLATHGQFSSNPEETFITTGQGERIDIDELGRLLRQKTQVSSLELLFLSACQTLAGDRWAALGMAGVAIRSGARSTIASIWNADDEASAELVTLFYQAFTQGQGISKAEALRQAQIAMIKNPRYALPVYWSPYVLIGNWQ